jgi:hypothetical protein
MRVIKTPWQPRRYRQIPGIEYLRVDFFILNLNFPFSIENKTDRRFWRRRAALGTHLLSFIARFESPDLKGESEILWLNNHPTETAIAPN